MSKEFNSVIRQLQFLEDKFNVIFKIELFTDMTGQVTYVVDTTDVVWLQAFDFSDLFDFARELNEFEKFLER